MIYNSRKKEGGIVMELLLIIAALLLVGQYVSLIGMCVMVDAIKQFMEVY